MKLLLALSMVAVAASVISAQAPLKPPATRVDPVTDDLHGAKVVDNYRWLEGDNADPNEKSKVTPDVAAWPDAQNAYTRSVLDGLPGRKALEDRLRPLMQVGAVSAPTARRNRY